MDETAADRARWTTESLPVARPVDAPASPLPMAPARAVSAETAALLPPVGIARDDAFLPQLAIPPAHALETAEPRRVRRAAAAGSSAGLTIVMIVTAMGVGALAMMPALDQDRNSSGRPSVSTRESSPSATVASTAKVDHVTSPPSRLSATSSRPSRAKAVVDRAPVKSVDDALLESGFAEITNLLRNRDPSGATARMRRLADNHWSETQAERIAQYSALLSAVHSFWEAFDDALDSAAAGRSVRWSGQEGVLVEVSGTHLVVFRAGQNVRIDRSELPDEVVRALAESLLDLSDPRNQVCLGGYLYVTEGADSSEVRRLWDSAAEAGEGVTLLVLLLEER